MKYTNFLIKRTRGERGGLGQGGRWVWALGWVGQVLQGGGEGGERGGRLSRKRRRERNPDLPTTGGEKKRAGSNECWMSVQRKKCWHFDL